MTKKNVIHLYSALPIRSIRSVVGFTLPTNQFDTIIVYCQIESDIFLASQQLHLQHQQGQIKNKGTGI